MALNQRLSHTQFVHPVTQNSDVLLNGVTVFRLQKQLSLRKLLGITQGHFNRIR
ncbi:Uncharacterised protein [Vibrio cholerae]|nr:Uncharacterised protein [Vibrio cholerae]